MYLGQTQIDDPRVISIFCSKYPQHCAGGQIIPEVYPSITEPLIATAKQVLRLPGEVITTVAKPLFEGPLGFVVISGIVLAGLYIIRDLK